MQSAEQAKTIYELSQALEKETLARQSVQQNMRCLANNASSLQSAVEQLSNALKLPSKQV